MEISANEIIGAIKEQIRRYNLELEFRESGTVLEVGDGIARVFGLDQVMAGELLIFPGGVLGMALNLEEDNVGCVLFGRTAPSRKATSWSVPTAWWRYPSGKP